MEYLVYACVNQNRSVNQFSLCFRSLIQKDINAKIEEAMREFAAKFFEPAFINIQRNLGEENVDARLINDVCVDALEHAKSMFSSEKTRFGVAEKSVSRVKRKV